MAMKLPGDPSGLGPEWTRDPTHLDPNGERYRSPTGDYIDFHRGRPGQPGWRGKDHWHHNGGDEHLRPGDEIPTPGDARPNPEPKPQPPDTPKADPSRMSDNSNFWRRMEQITGLTGVALIIYIVISEGSRLFPPRNLVPVP
jgi:hypothetical protein